MWSKGREGGRVLARDLLLEVGVVELASGKPVDDGVGRQKAVQEE
jgi:hypothetical protein